MESLKVFNINTASDGRQRIYANGGMRRILHRGEIDEIVGEFGSEAKRTVGETSIEVVPPIPAELANKLGEALIALVQTLDPGGSPATYDVTGPNPRPNG